MTNKSQSDDSIPSSNNEEGILNNPGTNLSPVKRKLSHHKNIVIQN